MVWLGLTGNGSSDPGLTNVEFGGGVTARRSRWRPVAMSKLLPLMFDEAHRNLPETVTRV